MYAVIDIETTGGSQKSDRITEIAIYIFDGQSIIEEFSTLINPERTIPYFISNLTGITNEMVANAPKFYEVAKKIVQITENKIFVAHNVGFDYNFICNEFRRLGYNYKRDILCTIKMSRRILPKTKSYSLGNICAEIGIEIENRHRAAGDAYATVKLLKYLFEVNKEFDTNGVIKKYLSILNLNPNLNKSTIDNLPEDTGIYYFLDAKDKIIYIGKSKNIYQRIINHLNNNSKRAIEMKDKIALIDYELTGSELVALLKESNEIKKHKPLYNRSQRRNSNCFALYHYIDKNGYSRLKIDKNTNGEIFLTSFSSRAQTKDFLFRLVDKYNLCQKLCGLFNSEGPCFDHKTGICNGACNGTEPNSEYNPRVEEAINSIKLQFENVFIIDKGRNYEEKSVVKISNGKYCGFGYISKEYIGDNIELMNDCIKNYNDNKDIQLILKSYLKRNKVERIISYPYNG